MAHFNPFRDGNTALITGGASGIGLAVAEKCHGYGMNVIIADNNNASLESATQKFASASNVEILKLDVSKIEEWQSLKERLARLSTRVDLLLLNAGIAAKGDWEDVEYFRKTFEVNLFGVVNGIAALLPVLQAQKSPANIVITGSKQGITNPPGNPAYNASKSAVKTIAEQLSYDLRQSDISVHLLVPGWVHTGLTGASDGRPKPDGAWHPEQIADYLEDKLTKGKFYIICPDNDVTEELDKKRMLWSASDAVNGRLPLSRWREESRDEAAEWIRKCEV